MPTIIRLKALLHSSKKIKAPTEAARQVTTVDETFSLRTMTAKEARKPIYQWFPEIQIPNSLPALYESNPEGWYCLAQQGTAPVASIASYRKSNQQAWYGYYFMTEKYRGTGLAERLFNGVMDIDIKRGVRKINFQCVGALEPLYNAYGFQKTHENTIHCAALGKPYKKHLAHDITEHDFTPAVLRALVKYDQEVQNGLNRHIQLFQWFTMPGIEVLVALNDHNEVVGYSCVHPFHFNLPKFGTEHERIAPLYADDPDTAERLLDVSMSVACAQPKDSEAAKELEEIAYNAPTSIIFDTDGTNPDAAKLAASIGLFKTAVKVSHMSQVLNGKEAPEEYYDSSKVYSFCEYGSGP